jgi:signal transduction histidine kinase
MNRFGWPREVLRWALVVPLVACGFFLTVLVANFLDYSSLVDSATSEPAVLLLGLGLLTAIVALLWWGLRRRLRWARWWETRLYWQFTLSYFLATLVAIVIGMFAGRNAGPFGQFRGSWLVNLFARLFDPTTNAGFLVALLAAVSGTLAGLFITRNLTRRLRSITHAAQDWSRGEFVTTAPDAAGDELGQLARDLNHMAQQLQTLVTTRQALAVTEERNRLARDLHDTVKQHVFAGALLVRAARKLVRRDPTQAEIYLEEAEALAEETQQELIALIRALRPAPIREKGLAKILQDQAAEWSRRMNIAVDVWIQGERETPSEVEEALYHILEEALANVARHSSAQLVEVRLTWSDSDLSLVIEDNGQGFDVPQVTEQGGARVGLSTMRERIEAVGGAMSLESSLQGTTVIVTVPLPQLVEASYVRPN